MTRKKILIIGASGHAKVIIDIIEKQNKFDVFGLIDTFKDKGTEIFGYKILGTENDVPDLNKTHDIYGVIIAIGDNWQRMQMEISINKICEKIKFVTAIHPNAIIGKNVFIGEGTVIMAGTVINADTHVSRFCILNTNSSLGHDSLMEDFSSIAPGTSIGGGVKIGLYSAVSLGAKVIENIEIGNNTIIGAGAVVLNNVSDYKVAYGIPAKEIRTREASDTYLAGNKKTQLVSKGKEDTYILEKHTLTNDRAIDIYKNLLHFFNKKNLFYTVEFQEFLPGSLDKFCYFLLNKNNVPIIMMPFFKRKIKFKAADGEKYYDISSPYGYSGPLLKSEVANEELIEFWNKVDKWHKHNNIVSEFVRFSLNNNHIYYSGTLLSSLNNVKVKILSEGEQWSIFKSKVRNNYRKAQRENLSIKIFKDDIDTAIIEQFYTIYISTMNRNHASKEYFHSKDYFMNFIQNNSSSIAVALVYKEDIAISTELIIIINNVMYSYLGGTLSDFFNLRPNDFLKIEMMNWARMNNMSHYILGGGRIDGDSLYQYKKSFSPIGEDAVFYTGRKVINQDIYLDIIKQKQVVGYTNISELIKNTNSYFPIYRQQNDLTQNGDN